MFIEEPGRDTKVTSIEEVTIAVRASDDYGVESLELRYRVNGGEEKRVVLADSGRKSSKEPRAAHTLFLEEMKLAPGDLIAYNAVARDGAGNQGAATSTSSRCVRSERTIVRPSSRAAAAVAAATHPTASSRASVKSWPARSTGCATARRLQRARTWRTSR